MSKEKENNETLEPAKIDKQQVLSIVEETLSNKLKYYRAIIAAFFAGFLVLVAIGLIGGADLIRLMHNQAFPPELPDHVAVSYESSLQLNASNRSQHSQSITFWSADKQRVSLRVKALQTKKSEGTPERKIVISVNGRPISLPVAPSQIVSDFKNITEFLGNNADITKSPEIHEIVFSFDDSQKPIDINAELLISALVLVRGPEA